MPSTANLDIYQGDDYPAFVAVADSDGAPADLTGYTAKAQIRVNVADRAPEVVVEIDCTITGSDIYLSIPHAKTIDLTGINYVWDLQLTSASGIITTILAGKVRVSLEVTRDVVGRGRVYAYR